MRRISLFFAFIFISAAMGQGFLDFLRVSGENPFHEDKQDTEEVKKMILGEDNDDDDYNSDYQYGDCLITREELKNKIDSKVLKSLSEGSIKRLRFIYGKCNPVLFIPGLMATRLELRIDCKEYIKDEQAFNEMNEH